MDLLSKEGRLPVGLFRPPAFLSTMDQYLARSRQIPNFGRG